MPETPKNPLTRTQVISMIVCTLLLLVYLTIVTWVLYQKIMEWFTLEWLMQHLEWAVALLLVGCIILFFFPILLGWQLRQDKKKEKEKTQ